MFGLINSLKTESHSAVQSFQSSIGNLKGRLVRYFKIASDVTNQNKRHVGLLEGHLFTSLSKGFHKINSLIDVIIQAWNKFWKPIEISEGRSHSIAPSESLLKKNGLGTIDLAVRHIQRLSLQAKLEYGSENSLLSEISDLELFSNRMKQEIILDVDLAKGFSEQKRIVKAKIDSYLDRLEGFCNTLNTMDEEYPKLNLQISVRVLSFTMERQNQRLSNLLKMSIK